MAKMLKTIIREGRKSKGLSYRQLGKKVNVCWSNLARMEKGELKSLGFHKVMRICKFFNIRPEDII